MKLFLSHQQRVYDISKTYLTIIKILFRKKVEQRTKHKIPNFLSKVDSTSTCVLDIIVFLLKELDTECFNRF